MFISFIEKTYRCSSELMFRDFRQFLRLILVKFLAAVSFSYSNSDSQEVSMNVTRTGNKKQGGTFKCNSTAEITPNQMRYS